MRSLLVAESAMGLFDGIAAAAGPHGCARRTWPRASGCRCCWCWTCPGQSQTAAAVALGMDRVPTPAVRVGGVVLNRVGSERHRQQAVRRPSRRPGCACWAPSRAMRRSSLPERHLGLVQAGEHPALAAQLERLADLAEKCLDLDRLLDLASHRPAFDPLPQEAGASSGMVPPGQRIALACDAAFSFTYPHLLAAWREAGADLLPFSPLADEPPPEAADCCWLPGGYPELHAAALGAAGRFHAGLRRFAATRPVHGECGGHMVLGAALTDGHGSTHAMTGLLGHTTSFARRALQLGYRRATLPDGNRRTRP